MRRNGIVVRIDDEPRIDSSLALVILLVVLDAILSQTIRVFRDSDTLRSAVQYTCLRAFQIDICQVL